MNAMIGGIVASVMAVIGTWLAARRQYSGSVTDSTAATLWEAGEALRVALHKETERLREQINRHEARIEGLGERVLALIAEHQECTRSLAEALARIARLESGPDVPGVQVQPDE